jgi:twitching motility protein PilJ
MDYQFKTNRSLSASKENMQSGQPNIEIHQPSKISFLQHFYNLPIGRKQLYALIACELVSILGVGIGATLIITQGLRSQLFQQAKTEVAITDIAYNIKVNQMGFGFRGQSDNPAIIKAAYLHNSGQFLNQKSQQEIKQILANEVKARKIEYATLVGQDLKIIANANSKRDGEIFNPNNLVSDVLKSSKSIKATRIISWSEINKEAPPLPEGVNNQDALIRYVVVPVKDPITQTTIGALVAGDIVNGKNIIVSETLKATDGGYSAVYFKKTNGEFTLATSLNQAQSQAFNQATSNLELPQDGKYLLETAIKIPEGKVVTGRMRIGNQSYTVAAKSVPSKIIEDIDGLQLILDQPTAILVRGTPETTMNNLLIHSLIEQLITVVIALILVGLWAIILRRSIIQPIGNLKQAAQKFTTSVSAGNSEEIRNSRAEVFANDEIGELTISFNTMADTIYKQIQYQENEARLALQINAITAAVRESLDSDKILKAIVTNTREAIKCDRTIFYSLEGWQGKAVAESVDYSLPTALGIDVNNPYDVKENWEDLEVGRIFAVSDIHQARLSQESIDQIEPFTVKAYLLAPVLVNNNLYGLFVAQQCLTTRQWQENEINLFKQVSVQVGYALEQAQLLQQIGQGLKTAESTTVQERQQKEALQMQLLGLLENVVGAASGDLTVRADVGEGEIGTVADFFNSIIESLRDIVTQVKTTATQVNSAIASNSSEISQLTQASLNQAAEINSTLNTVDNMTYSMQHVAASARQAATVANNAANNAEQSEQAIDRTVQKIMNLRETVGETAKKVKRLGESTQEISRVVSLINQIALQTNLLAINAGIEAARAGEQGQGFAIVAEEVGELAARSAFATQEIESILENIQKETSELVQVIELETTQVVEGTRVVEDAKQSLNQILEVSRQVDSLVQSISNATDSQVETSKIVSDLMKKIATTSQRTSASSRKVSESLQQTVEISQQLQQTVGTFKIN